MSRNHEHLRVFKVADTLALIVYQHTKSFPSDERFGLHSQLRRAAVSAVTNIVEGSARRSRSDYARFIDIALASATEVDYLISLCYRLRLLSREAYDECKTCTHELLPSLQKLLVSIQQLS